MLQKINKITNKKYTFIPNSNWNESIYLNECIYSNDIYSKYKSSINIEGELIICNDITKLDEFNTKIVQETYQEYLEIIKNRDLKKEQWVYNILDGKSENDKILYRDDKIVIIPNYTWNSPRFSNIYEKKIIMEDNIDLSKMHILTFPLDKSLHTIRSLNNSHVSLLKHIKNKTLEIIKEIYNFDKDQIKIYFHYAPSTYHLHVHFTLITYTEINSSVEYSHELSNVIFNLENISDYYQKILMNKRI